MKSTNLPILTVGHSNHTFEAFAALLCHHAVTAVADVRSAPYSRFNPQFNRETLAVALANRGIRYVFLGEQLGARSDDPTTFRDGRVQYARLAATEGFRSGIERLLRATSQFVVALMCAEKEPLDCHRTILIAPALAAKGVQVQHILANGNLEPHDHTLKRLLALVGLANEDMFQSHSERVKDALLLRERAIAHVGRSHGGQTSREFL